MSITTLAIPFASMLWVPLFASAMHDSTIVRDSIHRVYISKDVFVTAHPAPVERDKSPFLVCSVSRAYTEALGLPTLGTALSYLPSVRVETNCQTCNYSQVRINGMAGAYTQLLINGRPIISPLLTLYGLDQFPLALLDRIEVLRGPASVLYGSSAIAGVVNLITRRQLENSAAITSTTSLIGTRALENTTTAVMTMDHEGDTRVSLALIGVRRQRQEYDVNGDGFTELPQLRSSAFSVDATTVLTTQSFVRFTIASVEEERRGGNMLDLPPDRAEQAEYRLHDILFATATYEHQIGEQFYELFTGLTSIRRVHYTGVDQADGWGTSRSITATAGARASIPLGTIASVARLGFDTQCERTYDAIEAYGYMINQLVCQTGMIVELELPLIAKRLTFTTGVRPSWHSALRGVVFLGRAGMLWQPNEQWELRTSYSEGFRGPQAFEADMHIAFAGGGVSVVDIDPGLRKETARSLTVSALYRAETRTWFYQLSSDLFVTWLDGTFVLASNGTDSTGTRRLLRTNGSSAQVAGLTLELQATLLQSLDVTATATIQSASFREPLPWSQSAPAVREFLRTPRVYGSSSLRWTLVDERVDWTASAIITGPMLQPYMGASGDRLVTTPSFVDVGIGVRWTVTPQSSAIGSISVALRCMNLLDAYQRDFDRGRYRDSNYIYGPPQPRTFSVAVEWKR